jgi:hypothetical protein
MCNGEDVLMIELFPIFMNYTDGLVGDSPQLPVHIAALINTALMVDMILLKITLIFGTK